MGFQVLPCPNVGNFPQNEHLLKQKRANMSIETSWIGMLMMFCVVICGGLVSYTAWLWAWYYGAVMKKQHDYVDYNHNNQQALRKTLRHKSFLFYLGKYMDIFFKKGLRLGKYYRGKINQSGIIQAV